MGVMPLLELRILEIHSFPHFSLTCFNILTWNFAYDFVLLFYRSSLSVVNLCQFLWELYPLEFRILKINSFSHFSLTCQIELKFCIWLFFKCISDQVECCQFASFLWELCPFWNLQYWKYNYPHFSLTCFDILSWYSAYDFVLCTIDQVWLLSLCVHPFSALSSCIHALTNLAEI